MSRLRAGRRWMRWGLIVVLAMIGAGAQAADRPISGSVVDLDGKPVAGAEVVVALDNHDPATASDTAIIRRLTTDERGRFEFAGLDRATAPGPMSIWVHHSGSRLARAAVPGGSIEQVVPITLEPVVSAAGASIQVVGPRGEPIAGAQVVPTRWIEGGLVAPTARTVAIPPAVGALIGRSTDAEGQVLLAELAALRLAEVQVVGDAFGVQITAWNETLSTRHRQVWLRPVGGIKGLITGANPAEVAGLTVRVESFVGVQRVGLATATTDAEGQFAIAQVPTGAIEVRVQPRVGSAELPDRSPHLKLEPGVTADVRIALQRGVQVVGLVREQGQPHPIAGAWIELHGPGAGTWTARTDAAGRFAVRVRPGPVTARVVAAPDPWLVPPGDPRPEHLSMPAGGGQVEWPLIELDRGVMVRGGTQDDAGQPVPGPIEVEARWVRREGRTHDEGTVTTTTGRNGRFEVGPVPRAGEVTIEARFPGGRVSTPSHLQSAALEQPVQLIADPPGKLLAPTGRVVDVHGQPVAGALVQIRMVDSGQPVPVHGLAPGRRLAMPGLDAVITDAQGRYEGARRLDPGQFYLASAEAADCEAGRTRSVAARERAATEIRFADLVLDRHRLRSVLVGQVVDRDGQPIAGVAVRDMAKHQTTTDATGWFRLDRQGADAPAFLFARKAGYRFFGRSLTETQEERGRPLILQLSRDDEPGLPGLGLVRPAGTSAQALVDWMIRSLVVNPVIGQVLAQNDKVTAAAILERLAQVEPARAIGWLDAGVVPDHRVVDGLRRIAARHLVATSPNEAIATLPKIEDRSIRCLATLELVARTSALPRDQQRALLVQVDRDARSVEDLPHRVAVLAQVADAWMTAGDRARARQCLDEAAAIADTLPKATTGARAWSALIEPLALLDPDLARHRLDRLVDPKDLDRSRQVLALRSAATNPVAAVATLRQIRSQTLLVRSIPPMCYRLAPVDPGQARGLVNLIAATHPSEAAYAVGMMAASLARTNPTQAVALIHEAYQRLEAAVDQKVTTSFDAQLPPSVVAALLLPTVEAVDPGSFLECFWTCVALHPAKVPPSPRLTALLALMLDRYDRDAARQLFDPSRLNSLLIAPNDFAPLLLAAAQIAPDVACHWVLNQARLNQTSPPHHPTQAARPHLELVAALTSSDRDRWDRAAHHYLQLWTPGTPVEQATGKP